MSDQYLVHQLGKGFRLIMLKTDKFKTIQMGLFIHSNLSRDKASLNALLPSVLEQGCRLYPDNLTLQRKLENLFGAALSTDVIKVGERHIMAFHLQTAHDSFTGFDSQLFDAGLKILGSVVTDPLLEEGAFRQSYVTQEKNQRIKDIKALLNDKAAYATQKCLASMCAEERYGVYRLGEAEDYEPLTPAALYDYYKGVLEENPIDLYLVGDFDEEEAILKAGEIFSAPRAENTLALLPTETDRLVEKEQMVKEKMELSQAKMVLGLRTYTPFDDPLFCALMVYSGILGGFPHAKLFMKVREEAGLAYYINTRLERHKALMLISAGINASDYEKVYAITKEQMTAISQGKISAGELENTKRGLVNQLLSRQDSPGQLIAFHLDGAVGGKDYSFEDLIKGVEETSVDQIQKVAERIKLDTKYLLEPK